MCTCFYDTLLSASEQEYFKFALDLSLKLTNKEKALLFLLKELDYSAFETEKGRPLSIEPWKMMVVNVYGFLIHNFSIRNIVSLSYRDVFCMSVLGPGVHLKKDSVNRFRQQTNAIENIFVQLIKKLVQMNEIKFDVVFQDGTKIESRAGKYTYAYKKNSIRYIKQAVANGSNVLKEATKLGFFKDKIPEDAEEMIIALTNLMNGLYGLLPKGKIQRGRGHKIPKSLLLFEKADFYRERIVDNLEIIETIGEGRNSCSKNDLDATMMHLKEDHFKNGQTKPAYNIQHLTCCDYIVTIVACQDRTDYKTTPITLDKFFSQYNLVPKYYVADSGYDCLENFEYLKDHNIIAAIKPQNWEMRRKARASKNPAIIENMDYDNEKDEFTCMNGRKLIFIKFKHSKKSAEDARVYEAKESCNDCSLKKKCIRTKSNTFEKKKFSVTLIHMLYRKQAFAFLNSTEGILLRINRSIQAEGSFCHPKWNLKFNRFLSFGMERTFSEWLLVAIASNIVTFASKLAYGNIGQPFIGNLPDDNEAKYNAKEFIENYLSNKTILKQYEQLEFNFEYKNSHKGKTR